MPEYKAVRNKNRCPSHPGAMIDDILQDIHEPKTKVAAAIGISRQHLYDLLAEKKPVTPQVAVHLAKALGGSVESWLRMQAAYDAWHAEREVDVSKVRTLKVA